LTTDPKDLEPKTRRFTLVDGVVLTLAVCAFAAPFAARLQVEAHAAAPLVAVRSEVATIRPIDLDLGYEEQQAESAFFEGLGEPKDFGIDTPVELALVAPENTPKILGDGADHPLHSYRPPAEKAPAATEPEPSSATSPTLHRDVAVLFSPLILDTAIPADTSDEPPAAEVDVVEVPEDVEEVAPTIRVTMTAPPTMTPVPTKRPFHAVNTPITTVRLAEAEPAFPINVTPPSAGAIEEAPLPPLEVVALPAPSPSVEPPLQVRDIEPLLVETVEVRRPPVEPAIQVEPPVLVDRPPVLETVALNPAPTLPIEPLETAAFVPAPSVPDVPVSPPAVVAPTEPPVAVVAKVPDPARPVARITNGPRIALVIAAAGLNENVTRFAIDALPAGVTLAFAPVKAEAGAWAREAKQDGHTVLVEVPLEPVNKSRDPGPLTLRVADSPTQNIERLDRALAIIPVADGASSYLGARFNAEERAVGPLVSALASRNLMLFENEPTSRSVFQKISARANLPYARGVVKIDRDRNGSAVRAALDALEAQARRRGSAVGVGTALRSTISTVALWAKEAEKRGVRLVPIIEVAR